MSASIDGKTPVVLTVRQILATAGAILVIGIGAFWAIAAFTSSGLREDVSAIRTTLGTLQGSNKDNALNIKQSEVEFTKQVGALNVTLATLSARMDTFGTKVDSVNKSMQQVAVQMEEVQKQLAGRRPATIDTASLVEALKKAGYNSKSIVLVPYSTPGAPR